MKKITAKWISIFLALAIISSFIPMLQSEVKAVTVNQQNIADRADFFFNTTWVCQKNVNAWRDEFVFQKGETYHLPYGQPVNSGKFIGYGVELEDFLMAAADADSVFYSTQSEFNGWTSVYYATDCAAFVAMCWGTVRQDCSTLPYYSTYKGKPTEANVYSILQLGDALDSTSVGHVVLVSDLIYDDNGKLIQIEITEQTPPQLKRTYFTPAELAEKYGEEFGIYRYERTVPAVPEWGYTTECTNYAAYCKVEISESTPVMSLPCGNSVNSESVRISSTMQGEIYTATRLYQNTAGEWWYRINLSNDKIGYICADAAIYLEMLLDDISISDAVYPSSHVKGKTFSLSGNIYSRFNQLVTASGYIYQGFTLDGNAITGGNDYVTGNSYTLNQSSIDYSTSFGALSTGSHTIAYSANYRNYYVKDGTLIENSGSQELSREYFMVVSSSKDTSNCNHNYTETILSQPSCTHAGLSVFACSVCGKTYKKTEEKIEHLFGKWDTIPATCTKDGAETRSCTVCATTETNVLKASGHQYVETKVDGNCKELPHIIYTCSVCNDSYTVYTEEAMTPWQETAPDHVDPELIETKTQYRYSDLKVILSSEKELADHINLGETWETVKTEALDYVKQWPSGFDTTNALYSQYHISPFSESNSATTQVVVDSDLVTGYLYYHWCYNNSYFSQANKSGQYTVFHAYYSTTKPDSYRMDSSDNSYCTAHSCCSNTDWFFVAEVNTQTVTTLQKMYLQGQWQNYSDWSDEKSEGTDTRRVESRILYRYPDFTAKEHQYQMTEIDASCTEAGSVTQICTVCGDTQVLVVPATGHKYEQEITIKPGCETTGLKTFTCENCGDIYTEQISSTGHQYTEVMTAPTCTESGYSTYICPCGHSYVENTVAALGHSYQTIVIEATCTEDGSVTDTCANCGDSKVQTISAKGHSYEATLTAPNCTEAGFTTYTCSCGDTYCTDRTDPYGHSFSNGICHVCGESDPNYTKPVVIPTLTLKAPALEFKDMIKIIAFFTVDNITDIDEMGMITYRKHVDAVDISTADHVIPGVEYDDASERYFASSQGIHAKYLSDTVYLACYAKLTDGRYVYTKLAPYSAITYAKSQLKNSGNVELKQLVVAMLNYGTEAQVYFDHNVENLANAELTAEQAALPEIYREDMIQTVPSTSVKKQGIFVNNSGFSSRKPAISFEGAFCINYFFTPRYAPANEISLYYWYEDDYNNTDELTVENASGFLKLDGTGTGQYRGDINGISAKNLTQAVYVAAVYSDGSTTWTSGVLGYSIGTYCSSQISKDGDIAALAMATAVYGYHAKQYFGQ